VVKTRVKCIRAAGQSDILTDGRVYEVVHQDSVFVDIRVKIGNRISTHGFLKSRFIPYFSFKDYKKLLQ
jgi:hypothetical protein